MGNFWAILGHFGSFLAIFWCYFFGQKFISAIFITFCISEQGNLLLCHQSSLNISPIVTCHRHQQISSQVDLDVVRTPSGRDFLGKPGERLRQFQSDRKALQAPSRAYVAGATYKEERSGQLSILALFQVLIETF